MICPMFRSNPLTCPINRTATASYKAVPSMLMVAPTGATNFVILLSTPLFSSKHRIVIGRVAELKIQNIICETRRKRVKVIIEDIVKFETIRKIM